MKKRLSRKGELSSHQSCFCGKKVEVLPDGSVEKTHPEAKKLISANAQSCPEMIALLKLGRTLWGLLGDRPLHQILGCSISLKYLDNSI